MDTHCSELCGVFVVGMLGGLGGSGPSGSFKIQSVYLFANFDVPLRQPQAGQGKKRGRKPNLAENDKDAKNQGIQPDTADDKKSSGDQSVVLCWVCMNNPRAKVKQRECTECVKDWDGMLKDCKRRGEMDFFKQFKTTATLDQLRRMLYTWKQCRKDIPEQAKKRNMFPWSAVSRRWQIRRELTTGKGGTYKCYTAFTKHYVEQKGYTREKAHKHWEKRKADPKWRHGMDPEDFRADPS